MKEDLNVFTYINALNAGRAMDVDEKIYNKFLVTRFFSYFIDTVLMADIANDLQSSTITGQMHYNFYLNLISPRKRFTKWFKAEKNDLLEVISEYFQISIEKARQTMKVLKKEEIEEIKEWWSKKND